MKINEFYFKPKYTRGRVCKVLNITKDTLRHYEECGLVTPWSNPTNNYKYYSIADLEILEAILFLRSVDVSIDEIPDALQYKEIDSYDTFLTKQLEKVETKIEYWKGVARLLHYLKNTIEEYRIHADYPHLVYNTTFHYRLTTFNYENDNIEDMIPEIKPAKPIYHIIKLKIVGDRWIHTNRNDTTDLRVGQLCDETEVGHVCKREIPLALSIITFELLENLPQKIRDIKSYYDETYIFEEEVYIIEHICMNIYHQDALLRTLYLPILEKK